MEFTSRRDDDPPITPDVVPYSPVVGDDVRRRLRAG